MTIILQEQAGVDNASPVDNDAIVNSSNISIDTPSNSTPPSSIDAPANLLTDDTTSENDEEEYETSFSKLEKLKAKYGAARANDADVGEKANGTSDGKQQRRRRRGGYGNSSSVLESLTSSTKEGELSRDGAAGGSKVRRSNDGATSDDKDNESMNENNSLQQMGSKGNNARLNIEEFVMSDMMEENSNVRSSSHLLMEDNVDDEVAMDSDTEDGTNNGNDQSEDSEAESDGEEVKPRGRTKKRSSESTNKAMPKNQEDEKEDDEEEEFQDTEASGYGFSLGNSLAPHVDDEEEASNSPDKGGAINAGALDDELMDDNDESESVPRNSDTVVDEQETTTKEPVHIEQEMELKASNVEDSAPKVLTISESTSATHGEPNASELFEVVDRLFKESDMDTVTVKDIQRSVKTHFAMKKLSSEMKGSIKERLTKLVQGTVESEDEEVQEEESDAGFDESDDNGNGANDSSSDYESRSRTSQKKSGKSKRKSRKHEEEEDAMDSSDDSSVEGKTSSRRLSKQKNRSYKKRSRRSSSKSGKMAKHIRNHATKARLRQLEEARIRKEELGHLATDDVDPDAEGDDEQNKDKKLASRKNEEESASSPQLSEQDRQRALAIAARFDTNREELRVKRAEDRAGLIDKLRQKRLESIGMNEDAEEVKEEDKAKVDTSDTDNCAEKVDTIVESKDLQVEKPPLKANTNETVRKDDGPSTAEPAGTTGMIDLDESEEESDDDSDDELEILALNSSAHTPVKGSSMVDAKSKPKSALDYLMSNSRGLASPAGPPKKSSKPLANPRAALRNALRAKQIKAGNRWLARELGYKNGEDHIRDCKEAEHKKRKQILMMEQHAALQGETKLIANKVMDEPQMENTEEFDDEDDEELAMARQLEETEMGSEDEQEMEDQNAPTQAYDDSHDDHETEQFAMDDEEDDQVKVVSTGHDNEVDEKCAQKPEDLETPGLLSSPGGETTTTKASEGNIVTPSSSKNLEETITFDPSCTEPTEETESKHGRDTDSVTDSNNDSKEIEHSAQDQGAEANKSSDADHISDDETPITKKPKNAAWQAMLQKEKEALLREKKRLRRGGGLVDGEAEEEEEDEGIVGLEDFGFAVQKKNDDEDEDVDVDEDDLEHVVDDVSDDEGDEEAGDAARKRLDAKEEKDRHKEIIRRMREGYDGRRGGIASGIGGARGMHRFDQLVAADNRDDAKRLGLLNDDEINSEDEEGGEGKNEKKDGGDDEDDEAALLDKMLKERFLQRQDEGFLEEDFSDDEDDEDESGEIDANNVKGEDDEDREQDRLAKRFAKRARMNRILEAYEGDSEFTRSRLMDEDESMQHDLKKIKTTLSIKRGNTSLGNKNHENNETIEIMKKQKITSAVTSQPSTHVPKSTSNFLSHEGSLSLALVASRPAGRKRKTTFLSGGKQSSFPRSHSSSSSKSVSLNHVVFMTGDSQHASNLDSNSNSFSGAKRPGGQTRSRNDTVVSKRPASSSNSLWSKVCSKNFRSK